MLYFILWVIFLLVVIASVPVVRMLEKRGAEPVPEAAVDDQAPDFDDGDFGADDLQAVPDEAVPVDAFDQ